MRAASLGTLALLLASLAAPARALDCAGAVAVLFADDPDAAEEALRPGSRACAVTRWDGERDLWVVAAPQGYENLRIALVRDEADGTARAVAGPVEVEALKLDPFRHPFVTVVPGRPFGEGIVAVTVEELYVSTGRSTSTTALHLLRHRGDALRPVFAGYTYAQHSYTVPCGRGQRPIASLGTCRRDWTRSYRILPVARRGATAPDILVRDARTGRTVAWHRWAGEAYAPALFDGIPSLGEG